MLKLALHWQIAIGMALGAIAGVTQHLRRNTNDCCSEEQLPNTQHTSDYDSPNHITISWTTVSGEEHTALVDGTRKPQVPQPQSTNSVTHPEAAAWFHRFGRSTARTVGETAQNIGNLFLRLLQMVAVPLIITSYLWDNRPW